MKTEANPSGRNAVDGRRIGQIQIPPQKQEKSLKLERRLQRQERKGGVVFYQGHNYKKQTPYKIFLFS